MATATKCFRPVLGKMMRVTVLGADGSVPAPATEDATLSTAGFISVKLSAEIEEGTEIIQKRADGALCINEKQPDAFKRLTVEIEFCGVNPFLLSMISNVDVYRDSNGTVIGFTQPEGSITEKFAFELWTGLSGGQKGSGYLLLPYVNGGVLGDLEITGEDAITFSITGAYTKGGNSWGTGPYEVIEGVGTNEVQTLTITGTPTGGDFKLKFGTETTASILYNATAANVKTALEALDAIPANSLTVTGGPLPGTGVVVTFGGSLGSEDQPLMTVQNASFTGGTTPAAAVAQTTPGADGAADVLPTPLDELDHLLVLLTEVTAPTEDCSPGPMPALV